jgi:hypothetical protein
MAPRDRCAYIRRIVKHVLLSALSPMLKSIIVDALSDRRDVRLVSWDLADAAPGGGDIDVVLTASSDADRVDCITALLWRWPRSRVVVVANSGRDAVLWELVPRKSVLGDLCPQTLVNAICGERR